MHELGGLFCKTGDLWINRKNVQAEKNIELGRILLAQQWKKGAQGGLTMGFAHELEGRPLGLMHAAVAAWC